MQLGGLWGVEVEEGAHDLQGIRLIEIYREESGEIERPTVLAQTVHVRHAPVRLSGTELELVAKHDLRTCTFLSSKEGAHKVVRIKMPLTKQRDVSTWPQANVSLPMLFTSAHKVHRRRWR